MSFFLRSITAGLVVPVLVAAPAMAQQGSSLAGPPSASTIEHPVTVAARLAAPIVAAPTVGMQVADEGAAPARAASQATPVQSVPDVRTAGDTAHLLVGPKIAVARVGVAPVSGTHVDASSAAAAQHMGAGENVAMMVVGGGALVAGLIIGGDGGAVVAIGGAAIGLWGLYNYIK